MATESTMIKGCTATAADNALDVERSVTDRYAQAARQAEPGLCCPTTQYDAALLALLPQEIVEKDYGCGDPTLYVSKGDTVIDLGSGSGKACYMLSQKAGPTGRVIGVDMNDAMLALARKYQDEMGKRIGWANVRFVKAKIQDLALDLDRAERWLTERPIKTMAALSAFETECARLRRDEPVIAGETADVVVSNCVLNLVRSEHKKTLFGEIFRVLKNGGRAVISDIVCDEDPTAAIMADSNLWSGCIAGAFREDAFLKQFEDAGFYGVEILARQQDPWQVVEGIEFRSMTVRAFKGKEGPCLERHQAVVYRGPWRVVYDDDGHALHRGARMAVCDKTYHLLTCDEGPYAGQVIGIPPHAEIPLSEAAPFDCRASMRRDPRSTKGQNYNETRLSEHDTCCGSDGCC